MSILSERLKSAREIKGLKQLYVMKHTGISNKALSRYENGTSEPDVETLKVLADFYEVSVEWFMGVGSKHKHPLTESEIVIREIVEKFKIDTLDEKDRQTLEGIIQLVYKQKLNNM